MPSNRVLTLLAALTAGAALTTASRPAEAQSTGATVHHHPGWNLIARSGQQVGGPVYAPTLYTFQPGDTAYETVAAGSVLRAGWGYWLYTTADTDVTPTGGSDDSYQVTAPARQFFMIGDPSGTQAAVVKKADTVLIYDPVNGYQETTTLQPYQGAWAVSNAGETITVTPQGGPTGPPVVAQNLRTASGPKGYSFSAPSDWQTPSLLPVGADTAVLSADGSEGMIAYVQPLSGGAPADGVQFLTIALRSAQRDLRDYELALGPVPIPITGADSAARAVLLYTSHGGATQVQYVVAAVRQQTAYLVVVDVPSEYWNVNQDQITQWARSLRLGP